MLGSILIDTQGITPAGGGLWWWRNHTIPGGDDQLYGNTIPGGGGRPPIHIFGAHQLRDRH